VSAFSPNVWLSLRKREKTNDLWVKCNSVVQDVKLHWLVRLIESSNLFSGNRKETLRSLLGERTAKHGCFANDDPTPPRVLSNQQTNEKGVFSFPNKNLFVAMPDGILIHGSLFIVSFRWVRHAYPK